MGSSHLGTPLQPGEFWCLQTAKVIGLLISSVLLLLFIRRVNTSILAASAAIGIGGFCLGVTIFHQVSILIALYVLQGAAAQRRLDRRFDLYRLHTKSRAAICYPGRVADRGPVRLFLLLTTDISGHRQRGYPTHLRPAAQRAQGCSSACHHTFPNNRSIPSSAKTTVRKIRESPFRYGGPACRSLSRPYYII